MVDTLLQKFECYESVQLRSTRRFGNKNQGNSRFIMVELVSTDVKLGIMKSLKNKKLVWGPNHDQVYFSDHLTLLNNSLFYKARIMKRKNDVKYAWTKLGKIYIKKSDNSRAVLIKSSDQLEKFIQDLQASDSELANETEADTENEEVNDGKKGESSKRKHNTSNSDPQKQSPELKRTRNNVYWRK